jgi:hypothetical protein
MNAWKRQLVYTPETYMMHNEAFVMLCVSINADSESLKTIYASRHVLWLSEMSRTHWFQDFLQIA